LVEVKILEFLDLQKSLQHEQELRRAAEEKLKGKEEELQSSKVGTIVKMESNREVF